MYLPKGHLQFYRRETLSDRQTGRRVDIRNIQLTMLHRIKRIHQYLLDRPRVLFLAILSPKTRKATNGCDSQYGVERIL